MPGLVVIAAIVAPIDPAFVLDSERADASAHNIKLVLRPELSAVLDTLLSQAQDKLGEKLESVFGISGVVGPF